MMKTTIGGQMVKVIKAQRMKHKREDEMDCCKISWGPDWIGSVR